MKACGCGIEANIAGNRLFHKLATSLWVGALFDEAPLLQYVVGIFQAAVLRLSNRN